MGSSNHLLKRLEVFGGNPQHVYCLPLRNIEVMGNDLPYRAELCEVLDRVIIGPSYAAAVVQEAVIHILI
jgi:hypothetical protein